MAGRGVPMSGRSADRPTPSYRRSKVGRVEEVTTPPAKAVALLAPAMSDNWRFSDTISSVPPAASSAIVLRAPELSAEEAEQLAEDACAAGTKRAYAFDLKAFAAWCTAE